MAGWVPVACSLEGGEARRRSQQWQIVVGQRLEMERSDDRLTIRFAANDALRAELESLVMAERECCGFVTWEFDDLGDEMVLNVLGDSLGVTAMVEAFRLVN